MAEYLKRFFKGVAAGVLISVGGCVYLSVQNKVVGAVLFSVALLCICCKDYSLFTGKVGYIVKNHTASDFSVLFLGLAGNIAGACACAFICDFANPGLVRSAGALAKAKLGLHWYEVLAKAFMCGILMYLAVSIYKNKKTPLGIIFCIPTFILCGFEHSIADIYYLAAGFEATAEYFGGSALFILLVIAGNALGSMFIALFDNKTEKIKPDNTEKPE